MKIIVTGATGFLGQALVRRLIKDQHQVTALGRNLEKGKQLKKLGAEFVQVDLKYDSAFALLSNLPSHDIIVHAAGLSSPWGKYADFYDANVVSSQIMIKLARHLGCIRMVYISSPSIYFDWQDQLNITENTVLPRPINAYAATKRLAELEVIQAKDLSPIILRPRAIYGEGDTSLLPRLESALQKGFLPLLRNGTAVTNLTYVDDCVEAICLSIHAPLSIAPAIFNISGSENLAIQTIVEEVASNIGYHVKWKKLPLSVVRFIVSMMEFKARLTPRQPEPRITTYGLGVFAYSQTLDCTLAREKLGFMPRISFKEGLSKVFQGTNR